METDSKSKDAAGDPEFEQAVKQDVSESDQQRVASLGRAQTGQRRRMLALRFEKSRLAAKYGESSPQARRAQSLLQMQTAATAETTVMLQRAKTPAATVSDGEAVFFGRVLDDKGAPQCGFTVEGRGAKGRPLASDETDRQGNFRFSIDAARKQAAAGKPAPESAMHEAVLKLAVVRSGKVWLQSDESLAITAGRATYRELVLPAGGPCGDQPAGTTSEEQSSTNPDDTFEDPEAPPTRG